MLNRNGGSYNTVNGKLYFYDDFENVEDEDNQKSIIGSRNNILDNSEIEILPYVVFSESLCELVLHLLVQRGSSYYYL